MSAAAAIPHVLATACAVAEPPVRASRPKPVEGLAFYRKHTLGLLRRYLRVSLEVGRAPCILGNIVFRGHVSSYPMRSFEDCVIFLFDVEKCLRQLDSLSQSIVARVALEDYSTSETAAITGESERSVNRIFGEALDRLTSLFLSYELLDLNVENLSRGKAKN